jgi:hypothetical protein
MRHAERPTEMLLEQQDANRKAARYRNPETGQRHFCHLKTFRAAFVKDMLAIRDELRRRRIRK